ncbi:hypothetical protein ES708_26646 [subsurface metagenome]
MMSKNKNNNKNLECVNCEKEIDLKELLQVDSSAKTMESEKTEFIWDQLPEIGMDKRNIEKFSHMTDLGYKVLNVCWKCYRIAFNLIGGLL